MIRQVDLIPSRCHEALGFRAWVQGWIATYALVALLVVAMAIGVRVRAERIDRELARLNDEVRERFEQNAEAKALLGELESIGASVTRYEALAWPLSSGVVLDGLVAALPEAVTLTGLGLTPRELRVSGTKRGERSVRRELVAEVEGIARRDSEVAEYVSGLQVSGLFTSVTLDYARSADVDGVAARSFRLSAVVDLERRYKLVAHADLQAEDIAEVQP
ncbi:MAG: PilN domain-containing protein [Planctomycetota bacterium]